MKRILFAGLLSSFILGLSSCYKTCEDPFSPNYTLEGNCIDLTTSVVGTYTGQFQDSIVGLHNSTTNAVSIQITKVDNSHVALSSSGTSAFTGFSAQVAASANGSYLTVPAQTSNGLAVSGAGSYFGAAADGVFIASNNQITVCTQAGTQYETFTGRK